MGKHINSVKINIVPNLGSEISITSPPFFQCFFAFCSMTQWGALFRHAGNSTFADGFGTWRAAEAEFQKTQSPYFPSIWEMLFLHWFILPIGWKKCHRSHLLGEPETTIEALPAHFADLGTIQRSSSGRSPGAKWIHQEWWCAKRGIITVHFVFCRIYVGFWRCNIERLGEKKPQSSFII